MRCLDNSRYCCRAPCEDEPGRGEEDGGQGREVGPLPAPLPGARPPHRHSGIPGNTYHLCTLYIYTSHNLFSVHICDRFLLPLCYLKVETKNFIKARTTHHPPSHSHLSNNCKYFHEFINIKQNLDTSPPLFEFKSN